MPRELLQRLAVRPMAHSICQQWRMRLGSTLTFLTSPTLSGQHPIWPTCSRGGQFVARDMYDAGGVYMLMKSLLAEGLLHGDCLTVTGKTLGENIEEITWNPDQKVIYPASAPITPTGGVVGLRGTLAPDGAIVKVAGMERLKFTGPAQVFDCEEDCFAAVEARQIREGSVIVIRYEGPKGGPGMREMLSTTAALYGQGMGEKGCAHY